MVLLHVGKGVAVAGKLLQHADAVHNHVGDLIALVRGDGEGLVFALVHRHVTGGINAAACARRRGDGEGLGLRLGNFKGGETADGIVAALVILNGNGGRAHIGVAGIADGVLVGGNHGLAVLDGDNGGLDLAAGVLEAVAAQCNGGVADHLGIDGDGLSSGQFSVGNGQFRHADGQFCGRDGYIAGHDRGLAAGVGGGDHQASEVQALAVGVFGLVGGRGHGNALYRILRHGQGNAAGDGGVVGGIGGGEGPVVVLLTHGQGLTRVQRQGAIGAGVGQGDGGNLRGSVDGAGGVAHLHAGHGGRGLGDGDLDLHRVGVAVVLIAHHLVPDGVVASVDAGGDIGGIVAVLTQAVHHGAAGDSTCRYQLLGTAGVGQVFHGGGGTAGSRFANGQGQFAAGGGGVVILLSDGGHHGVGARIGGQAVGVRTFAAGLVLVGDRAKIGFIVHQGDGGGGDSRRASGVGQGLAFPAPGQGGGCFFNGVAGLAACLAGVAARAGDGDGVGTRVGAVAAVSHGVVTLGQGLAAQRHGDGGLLLAAVVGEAGFAQGHGGAGDVRWLRRGIRVIAVSIFVNAVDGAVGGIQHRISVAVVAQVLVPGQIFAGGAVEQVGYLAGGELIGGFDHGACRVGGKLALALVGSAGQVIAVADRGLGALVLAHDGAHIVGAIRRNGAGVVALADVDPAVVAVAQDAAHAAGAAHINRNAALVGAVLNGAGADVAHDTGHAARGHRNGDFAGVDAVFHRGAAVLGHGAHHAADVVVAGADGDVHPADHAADGAARRSGAQGADRAAHFRNGFIAGDGDAAGDGEVFDGAGDIAEQAGIAFGVFDGHTADGIALAVKGAGVGGALAADRGPGLAAQLDVRSQHRAGARILLRAVGQGAVDQTREPEQVSDTINLINAVNLLGRFIYSQADAAGGGFVVVAVVGDENPVVRIFTHAQGLAVIQLNGAWRVVGAVGQGDGGNVGGGVDGGGAAHRHIGHGGCGLGDLESACDGAGVVARAANFDGGLSRIGVVLIGEGVVGILGQRFAVQGDGDILPAGLFRIAVIDVTAAHLHLCAIQRFGVYGKGKADFRAGVVLAGNSEGFGITAHGKPGFGLDGKGRRPIRGKGGGDIDKARFRRDGVICAGGQRNCYRLVSGVGDGHGLPVGCFRIADCFIAEVQRRRGRRNGISRYELGDHDFQRLADILHRVFGDDVDVLCACCQICEIYGVLPACHIRTVTGNNVSRLRCAAFHDCIVIFARFVAGKLHRCGSFAVAGGAAIAQGRGSIVNGRIYFNQFAAVVCQLGIVIFSAVVLLVEYIQLRRVA